MGSAIDLKEAFKEYLFEIENFGFRAERFYDDLTHPNCSEQKRIDLITKWLEAAFIQGARVMAQDSCDTLRDYATALAGVKEPKYTMEEAYDNAAANLMVYYTKVLDRAEND